MKYLKLFEDFSVGKKYDNQVNFKDVNMKKHQKKFDIIHSKIPFDKVGGEITPNHVDLQFSGKNNFRITGKSSVVKSLVPTLVHHGFSPVTFKMGNVSHKFDYYPWSLVDFVNYINEIDDKIKQHLVKEAYENKN
jgi:hypothetical protein